MIITSAKWWRSLRSYRPWTPMSINPWLPLAEAISTGEARPHYTVPIIATRKQRMVTQRIIMVPLKQASLPDAAR